MSQRIEIELTSKRADGSWTWRAAGAREPKGELAGDLASFPINEGDKLSVEAEFHMDGIEILEVFATKKKRPMPETLEIMGSGRDQPLVTTRLVSNRRNRDDDRPRGGRERRERDGRKERSRPEPRREDDRPKAKRLRPRRTHRQALIDSLPEDQRPVAEKVVLAGTDSVEQTLREQRRKARDKAKPAPKEAQTDAETAETAVPAKADAETTETAETAESKTEAAKADAETTETAVPAESKTEAAKAESEPKESSSKSTKPKGQESESPDDFLAAARKLLPRIRAAEWRDRAEAALAGIDEVDLRDLRSVVVAAEAGAVDDEAKALADELRTKLTQRVEREHSEWLAEVAATLADGRMVRALRLSSRPPKAGVPLPQDMVTRLTEAASAALTSDTPSKRWTTVLGAVAFSPVRRTVQPVGIPEKPDAELLAEVKKLSERVPHIAAMFGVEPAPPPKRGRRNPGRR